MGCKILKNISSCENKPFKGYRRMGWLAYYEDIDESSIVIDGAKVSFALQSGEFFPLYDDSLNPYAGSGSFGSVSSTHGYNLFNERVKFPVKTYDKDSAVVVKALSSNRPVVIMLEQNVGGEARYPVFGLVGGLKNVSSEWSDGDDAVWNITLENYNTGVPPFFLYHVDDNNTNNVHTFLTQYEYIAGLSIGSGVSVPQLVRLELFPDRIGRIVLPNGTVLPIEPGGYIHSFYGGVAGNVKMIIQKPPIQDEPFINIDGTDFIGVLKANNDFSVNTQGSQHITGIHASFARGVYAEGCSLTATSIAIQLALAVKNIAPLSRIHYIFYGGNNAPVSTWSQQALADMSTITSAGGLIVYNDL